MRCPLPSPTENTLSELSTVTRLSWAALYGMVYTLIESDDAVTPVIILVSFL